MALLTALLFIGSTVITALLTFFHAHSTLTLASAYVILSVFIVFVYHGIELKNNKIIIP